MSDIFDDIIYKAKDLAGIASQKTGEVVEISRCKLECIRINNEIKSLYEQLGSAVYSMVKSDYENRELIEGLSEEIDELMMRLEAVQEKLAELRKVNICSACGTKNEPENFYCRHCGSRIRSEFDPSHYDDADDSDDIGEADYADEAEDDGEKTTD